MLPLEKILTSHGPNKTLVVSSTLAVDMDTTSVDPYIRINKIKFLHQWFWLAIYVKTLHESITCSLRPGSNFLNFN
jgi:hypothetical protein